MTRAELERVVTARLEPHREALIPKLRALAAHIYPAEVETLHFEVFCDGLERGLRLRAFFLDSGNSEFFLFEDGEAQYPCPVDPGLLETEPILPASEADAIYAEDSDRDYFTLAAAALIPWFADRWREAGGSSCTRSATVAVHDDGRLLELGSGQWVS